MKKMVATALVGAALFIPVIVQGQVVLKEGKTYHQRTETNSRWEWNPSSDAGKPGEWEFKQDKIYIYEEEKNNSKRDANDNKKRR